MKAIRDISLELDYEENLHTPKKYTSDFSIHCRFIGNYLRRQVKAIDFEPVGYNRLFISACQFTVAPNYVFENTLRVSVLFDQNKYDKLPKKDLPDFFIELYKAGIGKASQTHKVPVKYLLIKLEELKENGYENEWEFKSKTFKDIGIKAVLNCRMTMDFFSLTLMLTKKNEVVVNKEILITLPDEIIFAWQFKEIVLEGSVIKVLDSFKQPIYTLDLTSET
ncbi:hypothetical protein [Mucilaginibacter sp. L3T2-6]|uniref:hypothetical protein n=1 Tax=Mucilaginibacter sp. L3T2-6 TaxID=3062491 RepID=UPI002675CE08|nr:hypothetical protein [Mucilaginibacter sp. L3T2-6]MDO3645107.1 hypothetical protein [Mucilaginibacter sp. L3T2-6]MDV6217559.1 hypothetical protein [Mucilaginibacter sp. L3T2-6]